MNHFKHCFLYFCLLLTAFCTSYTRTPEESFSSKIQNPQKFKSQKIAMIIDSFSDEKKYVEKISNQLAQSLNQNGFNIISPSEFKEMLLANKVSREDLFNLSKYHLIKSKLNISSIIWINYKKESAQPEEQSGEDESYKIISEEENPHIKGKVIQRNLSFQLIDLETSKMISVLNIVKKPDEISKKSTGAAVMGSIIVAFSSGPLALVLLFNMIASSAGGNAINITSVLIPAIIGNILGIMLIAYGDNTYQHNGSGLDINQITQHLFYWLDIKKMKKKETSFEYNKTNTGF